jgi:hypothetical protein
MACCGTALLFFVFFFNHAIVPTYDMTVKQNKDGGLYGKENQTNYNFNPTLSSTEFL